MFTYPAVIIKTEASKKHFFIAIRSFIHKIRDNLQEAKIIYPIKRAELVFQKE